MLRPDGKGGFESHPIRPTVAKEEMPESRRIIIDLKERVLMPLEARKDLNKGEELALQYLNTGLLWLMEVERANFMKGMPNGQAAN